jgi:YbbR domain-containing protein
MKNLRASLLRLALAFGLSFALWAFVSFSQNPEENVTFPEMPLQVVGLGEDLVVVDSNGLPSQVFPTIDVTLRTDQRQLATLRQVDVRVVANLNGLGAGEHIVPLNVEATRPNISINVPPNGVDPAVVPIRLEQLSTERVPVRVDIEGNLPFSFERGEPRVSSAGQPLSTVIVSGPLNRVLRVTEARALVNIEQLRATYVSSLALTPLDSAGQAVDGVRLEPGTVTVQVPINPVVGLKLVPVEPQIVGLPAPGFEVRAVQVNPPLITLAGSSGPLDAVDVLQTVPLDLAGARQSVRANLPLIFPDGTSPREGEPDQVSVLVEIGPIERLFQVQLPAQVQLNGVGSGLIATVNPGVVSINVTGNNAALAELSQTTLRAVVNLGGLGPGVYTLTPQLELPPGVSLVNGPPEVEVVLRFPPPPPTATATAQEETPSPDSTTTAEPVPEPTPTSAPEPTPTSAPEPTTEAGPNPTPVPTP